MLARARVLSVSFALLTVLCSTIHVRDGAPATPPTPLMMRNAAFSSNEARYLPALHLYDEGDVVRWAIEVGGPEDAGCTFDTGTATRAAIPSVLRELRAARSHPLEHVVVHYGDTQSVESFLELAEIARSLDMSVLVAGDARRARQPAVRALPEHCVPTEQYRFASVGLPFDENWAQAGACMAACGNVLERDRSDTCRRRCEATEGSVPALCY